MVYVNISILLILLYNTEKLFIFAPQKKISI
nr:MAG TPA: hypothetical protein [Crassvirales sp.]